MKDRPDRRKRFVDEYLIDRNATQACIRAGYGEKNAKRQGHRLMLDPKVRAAIEVKAAKLSEKTGVTTELVLAGLLHNAESAQKTEDYSASNKAYELLGKHIGMFIDRSQVEIREMPQVVVE